MKDTLEQGLQEVLNMLLATKDFAIAQAPDVVQQLLSFKLIANIGFTVVFFMIGSISTFLILYYQKQWKKKEHSHFDDPAHLFWLIGTIFGYGIMLFPLYECIKIWVAPKVYIIEYISELINGKCL